MYIDYVLFWISGGALLITAGLVTFLLFSYQKGKKYKRVLADETVAMSHFKTTTSLIDKRKSHDLISQDIEATVTMDMNLSESMETVLMDIETTLPLVEVESGVGSGTKKYILNERYILEKEIFGGGMSRVFVARNIRLGNQWIIKFIPHKHGQLANEENILKVLNHINLPSIVDIFEDHEGIYLVESYIEGETLDNVVKLQEGVIPRKLVLSWAEQLAQVLNYLHNLDNHPILHLDLKPSNLMVTHDYKLVLIDFGISKRVGEDDLNLLGVSYQYAAPEQLKHSIPEKYKKLIEKRFGQLPKERKDWSPDERTDIYGFGAILVEVITGEHPHVNSHKLMRDKVSEDFVKIIDKCMMSNPDDRYQTIGAVLDALQKLNAQTHKMVRALLYRRIAVICATLSVLVSSLTFASGTYINGQENMANILMSPEAICLSLQQSSSVIIKKQMPDGTILPIELSNIKWTNSNNEVARIDGDRVVGMNIGTTSFEGLYRRKLVTLDISVVAPMDGMVNIAQHFEIDRTVKVYAGNAMRESVDGLLDVASFVSPEAIAVSTDGTVYVADSGLLRSIKDQQVTTHYMEPNYLQPAQLRTFNNKLYVLTKAWQDGENYYYALIEMYEGQSKVLLVSDGVFLAMEDFMVSSDGMIYYIERNAGVGQVYFKSLEIENPQNITTIAELQAGTVALSQGSEKEFYFANSESGVIQKYNGTEMSFFAGAENERHFIDGPAPLFYAPQRILWHEGKLYVWDHNTLRCLIIKDHVVEKALTVFGEASPTFDLIPKSDEEPSSTIVLPNSMETDFAIWGDQILLTDPKRNLIWTSVVLE